MEIRAALSSDFENIRKFLADNGWAERVADADRFRRMMENASRSVVAIDGDRVIGFARALSDDVSNGYIGTVAVAEEMRGRRIGRTLVEKLMGDDPNITWILRAGRGSSAFWRKMGFSVSSVAMERVRK